MTKMSKQKAKPISTQNNTQQKSAQDRKQQKKHQRLLENFQKALEQIFSSKSYRPHTFLELMAKLQIPEQYTSIFDLALQELQKNKRIGIERDRFVSKKGGIDNDKEFNSRGTEIIKGTLHLHPKGFGFVQHTHRDEYPEDIFIPKHLTQNAVDGDTVEVHVNLDSKKSEKGPEGRIIAILERSKKNLYAIAVGRNKNGDMQAYAPSLGLEQPVIVRLSKSETVNVGDRLILEVLEWGSKNEQTIGKVLQQLKSIEDPSGDVEAAIAAFGIANTFTTQAIEESKKHGTRVPLSEIKKREDLRNQECFTIDPDTAKDFDDALTLTIDEKGHYHLGVHIADVSYYVTPDSILDSEAQLRCNSTYFPGTCIPMLPKELSNNLCSLMPKVNRLTVSVFMEFDPTGELVNYRTGRTVIRSAKRFTYKEAKKVLDGEKKSVHAATLHNMVKLCGLLKKKRYDRGSIEFCLPDLAILVDDKGIPTGTDYIEYDITHQLVEEFMLKANELVATHLAKNGKNVTYRVHDEPAEENLKDFAILANSFGFRLPQNPTPHDMQALFDEANDSPYGQYLATSYIRKMRLAVYSAENIGHYGLGLTHYCHFTSPIRRYVDLVAHRILLGASDELSHLQEIAENCSEKERISAKAENQVVLLKKLRYLKALKEENPNRSYDAIITKVKPFGITFEILNMMIEGFLHVSELEDDYFVYDEAAMHLKGRHRGKRFVAGEMLEVWLKEVDLIYLESKWDLIHAEEETDKEKPKRKKRRK